MSANTMPDSPAPRPRRWPKLLLAASLTLNVLVLSLVVGAHLREDRDQRRSPAPDRTMLREGGFAPFFDAMPRDARKNMADALRAAGRDAGPDRAALAADFRDFVAVLRVEPFDPAALSGVLAAQHARIEERVAAGRDILVGQIAAMSPDERAAFADALEDRFRGALDRARAMPGGDRRAPPGH